MKNINEMSEKIEESKQAIDKKRKVTFAPDVENYQRDFTPYNQVKKKPNYSKMKSTVFQYLREGKYEDLDAYLKGFLPWELEEFFKEKGELLFSSKLIDANNVDHLGYLLNVVPEHIVSNILSKDNFHLIWGFLASQEVAEKNGHSNEKTESLAAAKIDILLGKGDSTIQKYINNFIPRLPQGIQQKLEQNKEAIIKNII